MTKQEPLQIDEEPPARSGPASQVQQPEYSRASRGIGPGCPSPGTIRSLPHMRAIPDFFVSARSAEFRYRYFPGVPDALWNDWHWQARNVIRKREDFERILGLSDDESSALEPAADRLPVAITPYYAGLIDPGDPSQPIRRTMVPVTAELMRSSGEENDPLAEGPYTPVPGLVHRYPDRVLFLVSDICSGYCRYCTRARLVGRRPDGAGRIVDRWNAGIEYIASNPRVRDVLVSGGDPLMLSDGRLEWLLKRLSAIPHVEIIRIGTKAPATLPQRITVSLVRMLKRYQPLWINIHCTHPDELTGEMHEACRRLADAGIPLQGQTVLLAGVNDRTDTLMDLFHGLLRMRVRPYYLFQCDPISGSGHFRTPLSTGLAIMQELRGYTTGFAVPLYVIDTPGGGGKIPVMPECVMRQEGDTVLLKNFEGKVYRYQDNAALSRALLDPRGNQQ